MPAVTTAMTTAMDRALRGASGCACSSTSPARTQAGAGGAAEQAQAGRKTVGKKPPKGGGDAGHAHGGGSAAPSQGAAAGHSHASDTKQSAGGHAHGGGGEMVIPGLQTVGPASDKRGVRNAAVAQANLEKIRAWASKYADPQVAIREGYNLEKALAFYNKRGDAVIHGWGGPNKTELMYERTTDGKIGRLLGVMMTVTGDLGAGVAHKHGSHAMQHIWFHRPNDLEGSFDRQDGSPSHTNRLSSAEADRRRNDFL